MGKTMGETTINGVRLGWFESQNVTPSMLREATMSERDEPQSLRPIPEGETLPQPVADDPMPDDAYLRDP